MSFAKLQEKILDEAKEQLAVLEGKQESEFKSEEKRIKNKARLIEEDVIARAKADGEQEAKRLHQTAQLEARADILRAKQEELDQTLAATVEAIVSWDSKDAEALLEKLFALIPKDATGNVVAGSEHEELVRSLAKKKGLEVNKRTLKGEGGFAYHGSDAELNLTVSYLVKLLFKNHRAEIAQMLF